MKGKLQKLIQETLKTLDINESNFSIEHPEDFKNGDYSTNVAMVCAKQLKTNPQKLAEKIVFELSARQGLAEIKEIQTAGSGFINFYLSREFFADSTKDILEKGDDWGKNEKGKNKKVIVEYSSPNIAKPFTVGHLRSTIIGDSIARILTFSGFDVIRDNHLGDWGTQFGKLIVAIKKWGNLGEIEKSKTPIKLLVDLYVKFHDELDKIKNEDDQNILLEDGGFLLNESDTLNDEAREWFAKLEKKDSEAIDIWKRCIDISKKEFDRIYKKLNVTPFDTMYGESFFEDKMKVVIDEIKEKKIGKESEGAFIIEFAEDKKIPPLLLLKKDGSSLYALRDLAADKWRKKEYGKNIKIINEVGSEQKGYFEQIIEAEKMLGYFTEGQRVHVAHGLYRFPEGKMSTRKGNVIWLEDIINEAEKRAGEINEETKEMVAIGALKFNDLKRDSLRDILFNWEEILNIKGDSGTYLQYAATRANSILKKTPSAFSHSLQEQYTSHVLNTKHSRSCALEPNPKLTPLAGGDKIPEEITDLEKYLYQFPEIVEYSYESLQPHHIATYLTKLASAFNTFYGNTQILMDDNKYMTYHLKLIKAFTQTMKNGLWLLGIEIPEKM